METNANNDQPERNDDAERIERRIDRYRTTKFTGPQAAAALPPLKDLVRKAAPSSVEDAKCLLGSGATFLAWAAGPGPCDVERLLDEATVSRWSHAMKHAEMNGSTLANHLGCLNRLLRAKAGLPTRPRRQPATATSQPPYDHADLADLVGLLLAEDPPAAALVLAGAGCGVVIPMVVGGRFRSDGVGIEFVLPDSTSRAVAQAWTELAKAVVDITVDGDAWDRVRAASRRGRTRNLVARRLNMTWSTAVLSDGRPVAAVLRLGGLTRRTLDTARPHLADLGQSDRDRFLRG